MTVLTGTRPLNPDVLFDSAHWYLAVICFPELRYPVYKSEEKATTNGIDGDFLKKEPVKKETPADTLDEKEKDADNEPVVKEEIDDKKGDGDEENKDLESGEKEAAPPVTTGGLEEPSPSSTHSTPRATSTPSADLDVKDRPKVSMTWIKINKKLSGTGSSKENVVEAGEDTGKTLTQEEPKVS